LEAPRSGSNPRIQLLPPEYKEKESSKKVVSQELTIELDIRTEKKYHHRSAGAHQWSSADFSKTAQI
jgi:hypothetical protein